MIVTESFLICDGCGETFGVDNRHKSGTQHRVDAKKEGWKLIVRDGSKYGDYCPECLIQNKHKITIPNPTLPK